MHFSFIKAGVVIVILQLAAGACGAPIPNPMVPGVDAAVGDSLESLVHTSDTDLAHDVATNNPRIFGLIASAKKVLEHYRTNVSPGPARNTAIRNQSERLLRAISNEPGAPGQQDAFVFLLHDRDYDVNPANKENSAKHANDHHPNRQY
ncbi:hypothetical protein FRB96_007097 [Tulasnella sp. 330]|nr:hypothetical protein FRB96_007097 [Tulasnella sp. 330]KAG8880047.1 hypothetical protein FRB97_001198 [Tulasnella sp. 331]KAG8887185.1 hypothetical protein FRB98_000395 [Tulasnella sp. 332]